MPHLRPLLESYVPRYMQDPEFYAILTMLLELKAEEKLRPSILVQTDSSPVYEFLSVLYSVIKSYFRFNLMTTVRLKKRLASLIFRITRIGDNKLICVFGHMKLSIRRLGLCLPHAYLLARVMSHDLMRRFISLLPLKLLRFSVRFSISQSLGLASE